MDKKAVTACFTGHRDYNMTTDEVRRRLSIILDFLISRGVIYYGCGGAWGFDLIAADVVIEKKRANPKVKLILVLPCKDQDKCWQAKYKADYCYIKTQADKIVYTSELYSKGCMHKRNRHLVDNSKYCVALLEKLQGGTFYTFRYALDRGLEIYNLATESYLDPVECGRCSENDEEE